MKKYNLLLRVVKKSSAPPTIFVIFSLLLLGGFLWWVFGLRPADISSNEKIYFVVNKGDGVSGIADKLGKEGIVKNSLHFKLLTFVLGTATKIKAGGYYLSPSMTPTEIAGILIKGVDDQWVTIIEGLRLEEIGEILIRKGFGVDPQEWVREIKGKGLEGKLFPDSYLFPRGASQGKILQVIDKAFQKKVVAGLADSLQKSRLSLKEVLILSSLVEREAKNETDRQMVAGILIKRLGEGWPLQVDATVQYVIASQKCSILKSPCTWWPNNLSKSDLQAKSPYNTYLNKGLPPGPICNPGLSSIKAVLNPQDSPHWFYISGKDGKMHYAKTSEEHQQNIQKFLK